jgi:hypothetical protein
VDCSSYLYSTSKLRPAATRFRSINSTHWSTVNVPPMMSVKTVSSSLWGKHHLSHPCYIVWPDPMDQLRAIYDEYHRLSGSDSPLQWGDIKVILTNELRMITSTIDAKICEAIHTDSYSKLEGFDLLDKMTKHILLERHPDLPYEAALSITLTEAKSNHEEEVEEDNETESPGFKLTSPLHPADSIFLEPLLEEKLLEVFNNFNFTTPSGIHEFCDSCFLDIYIIDEIQIPLNFPGFITLLATFSGLMYPKDSLRDGMQKLLSTFVFRSRGLQRPMVMTPSSLKVDKKKENIAPRRVVKDRIEKLDHGEAGKRDVQVPLNRHMTATSSATTTQGVRDEENYYRGSSNTTSSNISEMNLNRLMQSLRPYVKRIFVFYSMNGQGRTITKAEKKQSSSANNSFVDVNALQLAWKNLDIHNVGKVPCSEIIRILEATKEYISPQVINTAVRELKKVDGGVITWKHFLLATQSASRRMVRMRL